MNTTEFKPEEFREVFHKALVPKMSRHTGLRYPMGKWEEQVFSLFQTVINRGKHHQFYWQKRKFTDVHPETNDVQLNCERQYMVGMKTEKCNCTILIVCDQMRNLLTLSIKKYHDQKLTSYTSGTANYWPAMSEEKMEEFKDMLNKVG